MSKRIQLQLSAALKSVQEKGFFMILCMALSVLPSISWSQDADSLFNVVRKEAEKGNYEEALKIGNQLYQLHPDNVDYGTYLGRIYSWKGDYEPAILILSEIHDKNPGSYDVLEALVNAYAWSGNYESVVTYGTKGAINFPEQAFFFLKNKAIALSHLGKDAEALVLIDEMLAKDPDNHELLYLRTTVLRKKKNTLSLSYQNTSFSNPGMAPWHLGYLEYRRAFEKAPSVFRVNYGQVYGRTGLLYEADVYPKLSQRSYLYLNGGFSSGEDIFPRIRAGAEYYRNFGKRIEASLGTRFLKFDAEEVTMLTGNFSFSHKKWSVSYRPFLAFINSNSYLSNGISFKRFSEIKEQFLQLDVQYGIVPYTFFFSNEINRTGTFRLGIQYQWRIAGHYFIRPFVLYEYEEYVPDQHRNRFNVQLTLSRRF